MAAFCAPSHPLATRSPLSLDDLLTAELLLREPGSAIRDAFDSALLLRDRCAEPAWTSVNSPPWPPLPGKGSASPSSPPA